MLSNSKKLRSKSTSYVRQKSICQNKNNSIKKKSSTASFVWSKSGLNTEEIELNVNNNNSNEFSDSRSDLPSTSQKKLDSFEVKFLKRLNKIYKYIFICIKLMMLIFISFFLELFIVLFDILINNLICGLLTIIGDYLVKPVLSGVCNNLIEPFFKFTLNILVQMKEITQPFIDLIGELISLLSKPIEACRIFSTNNYYNKDRVNANIV